MDVPLDWVVIQRDVANAFNTASHRVMFEELCDTGGDIASLIPFVGAFYGSPALLFYPDHLSPGSYTTILSETGTR